jgi:hypothetical protein
MLTTRDQPAGADWSAEVGADLFLHKPIDLPALFAVLVGTWRGKQGWEKFARVGFTREPEARRA